jgi:hypothetical protein
MGDWRNCVHYSEQNESIEVCFDAVPADVESPSATGWRRENPWGGKRKSGSKRCTNKILAIASFILFLVCVFLIFVVGKSHQNPQEASQSVAQTDESAVLTGEAKDTDNESDVPTDEAKDTDTFSPVNDESRDNPTTTTTDQEIYEHGEVILVSFSFGSDAIPRPDDWIGLYPASSSANNKQLEPITFLYVCNRRFSCDAPVRDE